MKNVRLEEVGEIVRSAGRIAMSFYDKSYGIAKKNDRAPVTEADLAVNKFLVEKLGRFGYPILSEENEDNLKGRKDKECIWIVDPLDGTRDFIANTGEFSVLIGLVQRNIPTLGIICEPVKDCLYFAEKGRGAFCQNGGQVKKLIVSKVDNFEKMKILFSRNHLMPVEEKLAKDLKIGQKIPLGSAGLKMAKIARGEAEIYINSSDQSSEWDTCAGNLILKEAGGVVTDMNGKEIVYNQPDPRHLNGYVASNGEKHNQIIKSLRSIVQKKDEKN